MEIQTSRDDHDHLSPKPTGDYHSNVDTSRPFSSVKEAVAVFGQRILSGEMQTLNPIPKSPSHPWIRQATSTTSSASTSSWKRSLPSSPQNPGEEFLDTLKKLEGELEETKMELRMLKERGSETEVALASLNAELHKNMSKLAKAEAEAAAKSALAVTRTVSFERINGNNIDRDCIGIREEERRKELRRRMGSDYPTLAQILGGINGERKGYFGKKEKKMMKKKPIVPLVGDLFFKKKGSAADLSTTLDASPNL